MKIKLLLLTGIATVLLLSGCNMATISNSVKGHHYLRTGNHQHGIITFKEAIRNNPDNASGHYYLGRFLLAQNNCEEALSHLMTAATLDADANYFFWRGVAYGQLGDVAREKDSYNKALFINQKHTQSLLYLAHLTLDEGNYHKALKLYNLVLKQYSTNPSALYNRALSLKLIGNKADELEAWLDYLNLHPAGYLASRASDHLNRLDDFTYRNHYIGNRTITLKEISYTSPVSRKLSSASYPSIKLLGAVLINRPEVVLQIVVYREGNTKLARKRSYEIREYIFNIFPEIDKNRVQVSWFGDAERLGLDNTTYTINESVRFFGTGK